MLAVLSLTLPRIRGWKRWVAFIAASVPFAVYYVAAGAVAALLDNHLSLGSMTAAMLALSILTIPVLIVHFRLFDRPEVESRPAAPLSVQRPQRFAASAILILPALLSLAVVFDLTEASGLPAVPPDIVWISAAGASAFGAAIVIDRFDPSRRLIQGVVLTGATVGACALAVAAAALAGPAPSPLVKMAMEVVPMMLLFAVGWWHLKSVHGRDGATSAPGATGTDDGRSGTAGSTGPE